MLGLIFKRTFSNVLFPFDLGISWISPWSVLVRELKTCNIDQLCKIPRGLGKVVKNYMEMPVGPLLYENFSFFAQFLTTIV